MTSTSSNGTPVDRDAQMLQSFANTMLSAWEEWIALNLDTLRSFYSSASINARAILDDALSTQIAAYEETVERTSDYLDGLSKLGLRTHAEVAHLQAQAVLDSTGSAPGLLSTVGAPGPGAAYDAIAVLRATVGNSNAIYKKLLQTSRELADSNLSVAVRALDPIRSASRRMSNRSKHLA